MTIQEQMVVFKNYDKDMQVIDRIQAVLGLFILAMTPFLLAILGIMLWSIMSMIWRFLT